MASLSDISIKRPVLSIVMSVTIIVFGLIGYSYLGIREYPSVDPPVVTVQTSYTGANADIIESQITEPLEESINGIAGIKTLSSSSRDGRSNITVEFDLAVNIEDAANDVRDRVSRSMALLPKDVDPPVVSKADADSNPIYNLNIYSNTRDLLSLNEIATRNVKEKLQTIPGVSSVQMWGEKKYAMRLHIDPERLASFRLTAPDIVNALTKQNIELPSGSIEGNNTELTVRTQGRMTSVEDFNNLIIREEGDRSVKFSDVGNAELAPENEKTFFKRDMVPMISIAVVPQPGSNQIEIVDQIHKKLVQIQSTIPGDVILKEGFDNTKYVRKSIEEVEETILTAILLVTIVIFLFLRDWRSTIIPLTAIPVSLIGVFFFMYLAGFSINVLTLLGIVLSIGLVVDDAIVVLENIYTKIEEGLTPWEAALAGSKEIYFAVISTTVTLAAVFLPVIFLQGITGQLFREFGIVVAGSVIISAFVSLTLTPMLSSKLLKGGHSKPWFYNVTEPFFVWLTSAYENSLQSFLKIRWVAWVIMISLVGVIYGLFKTGAIPSELAPLEDRGQLRISATAPEGATFDYMLNFTDEFTEFIMKDIPAAERSAIYTITSPGFGNAGSNSGMIRVLLSDSNTRRSQQAIVDALQPKVKKFSGAKSIVIQEPTLQTGQRGGGGLPVAFVIQAPNFEKLKKMMPQFMAKVRDSPKFEVSDINLKFTKPELRLEIDRAKAQNLGVSIQDVAQTLQLGLSGRRFGYFIMDGKQYQVIGQINRSLRNDVNDLKSLYVKNNRGDLIQLDNMVKITEQSTPPQLFRFNRYSAATVTAQMAKGVTLGEALDEMDKLAKETFDETFSTAYDGQSKQFKESSSSLLFAFALAILLIYLILSAQFESFIDPFIILFTVPLAVAGALLSLWDFSQTLNIFSQIGIIVLIGLVTKNGILIVEFANQKKETGLSKLEAVKSAATARFRPIIMTSLCTILGILPIALALGSGSTSRVSMGIAVVGGMLFSTTLTLYVIPAIYSYMSRNLKKTHVD
ncbi:efflux RND transporter permease subunit [Aquirufa regiilacus]|uniref:Efflux RND transporter permease subunit n=1 Tax=Aquirufa regiilacus TaxID=3024868 RepID=A0ABU3TSK0_9BACT|nr:MULTISPECIES: efflux RND transporter permease subunit [unclassified Aquirufa]MDT8886464.1 efflux RND transporter permease subunit [Aquirufa sp. LEPPI-3A]MDU0808794.1 efflux RND transporter permease subunit [Aquirufa sp. LEOWEIH-7C]